MMKCPQCAFENKPGKKFCIECGRELSMWCPECGSAIEDTDKFCGECGYRLKTYSERPARDLSYDEKIEKIKRYLPKGITEKVLSQRDKIEGERKQVSVMFSDMKGFTELTEKLGAEEAYGVMDRVYEILIHKVHDYGGTVNEMTGDGIMALFGAPIALEDAPQRAIRAAYSIHREMAIFSDTLKTERGGIGPIKMRIGIHTGPVVVGTLGNDLRVEFKAVGDTVNLASRMESLAEPGATYVTQETFKLTEGFFRYEALGTRDIKGKKEPAKVYRVIAPSNKRTRFGVSAERGLTPFVGREREIELLLDAFERAKGGRGQAVSVVAEAGLGKSRLVFEFRKAVINENATFLEGKCFSYGIGVAYNPFIDILKSNFNVQEGDNDTILREKVKRGLKALKIEEASALPYLLEILSIRDSGIDKLSLSPEARKNRIMEALKQLVLKGSEIRPLILVCEDLHWIDSSSEEVLKYVLDSIPATRVLLIFTYRPEYIHTWGAKSFHNQLSLNRLSNRQSLMMVNHLLEVEQIESDLEELILEKSEGIPFFVEEIIKSIKELNIIERKENRYYFAKDIQGVTIPSTIQDVIMARVDSLPEKAKTVLRIGSVIEREFSHKLLEIVTDFPGEELLSSLSALKDSELIYERGIYPHSAYIFKHALTREVVYDSILTKRKKALHSKIGEAIEIQHQQNISELYGILAGHFFKSENNRKGADYSKKAAKKAQQSASFEDAFEYAKMRIVCLERMQKSEMIQRELIDARTTLASYYFNLSLQVQAKEAVAPIVELAEDMNYRRRLPMIYLSLGVYYYWVDESYSKGLSYLYEALKVSEEVSDFISLYLIKLHLGWTLSWECSFSESFKHLNKCLDLSTRSNNPVGIAHAKGVISVSNHCFSGDINLAFLTTQELMEIAVKSGDIYISGMAHAAHGVSCYFKGLFDEAEYFLSRGLEYSKINAQVGWVFVSSFWLGEKHFETGEFDRAIYYYKVGVEDLEQAKILPYFFRLAKICIARVEVSMYDRTIDLESILNSHKVQYPKVFDGWIARYCGEIFLKLDTSPDSRALPWIEKAIEADKNNSLKWALGKDYALYSELYGMKGDKSRAKECLLKAIDIFRECGADGWEKKNQEKIAEFS